MEVTLPSWYCGVVFAGNVPVSQELHELRNLRHLPVRMKNYFVFKMAWLMENKCLDSLVVVLVSRLIVTTTFITNECARDEVESSKDGQANILTIISCHIQKWHRDPKAMY